MRKFDEGLLNILKTEMPGEIRLKKDPDEREDFKKRIVEGSGNSSPYTDLRNLVSIGRQPRYVELPEHRNYIMEVCYQVSGEAFINVDNKKIHLKEGDFFIPNQYTTFSRETFSYDDIMVSFMIKPQFIEEVAATIGTDTVLSSFFLDYLKKNIVWNRYIHFKGLNDISVLNQVESMLFIAFPYLSEDIIGTGITTESNLLKNMMQTLIALLSRNLDSISDDGNYDYDGIIKEAVIRYLENEYNTASLQELSSMVNQSEYSLSRQIKKIFGVTFKDLLLKNRFERAKVLLSQTNLPVADIALAVGYENTSFFYRKFRETYGISPKEYRMG